MRGFLVFVLLGNDPLLQERLFPCLDTPLSRLGGPHFHRIQINTPKCLSANLQDDGHMQMGGTPHLREAFIAAAKTRQWDREAKLRTLAWVRAPSSLF